MALNVKYQYEMDAAREGALANQEPRTLISRDNMDAQIVGFGIPVAQHATMDKGATTVLTGTADIVGITVIDRSTFADRDLNVEGFRESESLRIIRKGCIWVRASVAVKAGDPIHVIRATGLFTNIPGTDNPKLGRYDTNAAAGALVIARLD